MENNKHRQIFVVGYSLGGNVLVNILADSSFDGSITAAFAMQPALDLQKCNENCRTALFGFYNYTFADAVKEFLTKSQSVDIIRNKYNKKTGT